MRPRSEPSPMPWRMRRNCSACGALERVVACREVQAGVAVADVARDADVDAADRVGHVDDARPADRRGELDVLAGELPRRSATVQARPPYKYDALIICALIAEYCSPSASSQAGIAHEHVARERDDGHATRVVGDVHEHRDVVALAAGESLFAQRGKRATSCPSHESVPTTSTIDAAFDRTERRRDHLVAGRAPPRCRRAPWPRPTR